MPQWNVKHVCACIGLVFLSGCSDADPTVTFLKPVDKFDFVNSNITTASLSSVPLTANCTRFIKSVDVSFDGGTTWIASTTYDASSSSCSSGQYTTTITNNSSPLNSMTVNNGDTVSVQFRAFSMAGHYVYRTVSIKYAPSTTIKQAILAGATTSTGSGIKLKGRALASEQLTATGTNMILKGRIVR